MRFFKDASICCFSSANSSSVSTPSSCRSLSLFKSCKQLLQIVVVFNGDMIEVPVLAAINRTGEIVDGLRALAIVVAAPVSASAKLSFLLWRVQVIQ